MTWDCPIKTARQIDSNSSQGILYKQVTWFRFVGLMVPYRLGTTSLMCSPKHIIIRLTIIHTEESNQKSKIESPDLARRFPYSYNFILPRYQASPTSDVPVSIPHRMHENRVLHCFQSRLLRCDLAPISHSLAQIRKLCRRSLGDLVLLQPFFRKPLEIDNVLLFHL